MREKEEQKREKRLMNFPEWPDVPRDGNVAEEEELRSERELVGFGAGLGGETDRWVEMEEGLYDDGFDLDKWKQEIVWRRPGGRCPCFSKPARKANGRTGKMNGAKIENIINPNSNVNRHPNGITIPKPNPGPQPPQFVVNGSSQKSPTNANAYTRGNGKPRKGKSRGDMPPPPPPGSSNPFVPQVTIATVARSKRKREDTSPSPLQPVSLAHFTPRTFLSFSVSFAPTPQPGSAVLAPSNPDDAGSESPAVANEDGNPPPKRRKYHFPVSSTGTARFSMVSSLGNPCPLVSMTMGNKVSIRYTDDVL